MQLLKSKNEKWLINQTIFNFSSSHTTVCVIAIHLQTRSYQYLYHDDSQIHLTDPDTFDQIAVDLDLLQVLLSIYEVLILFCFVLWHWIEWVEVLSNINLNCFFID